MADTSDDDYAEGQARALEDKAADLHREARELERKANGYRKAAAALRAQGAPDDVPELHVLAGYTRFGNEERDWLCPPQWDTKNWDRLTRLVRAGLLYCGFRSCLDGSAPTRDDTFCWQEPLPLVVHRVRHTPQEWEELKQRYGNVCLACGISESVRALQKDHIVPRSKHGCSHIDNMQPLCGPCNIRKGARTINYRPDLNGHQAERSES